MKKFIRLLLLFLMVSHFATSQKTVVNEYAAIDKKALLLPDSLSKTTDGIAAFMTAGFAKTTDRARGIFTWVASSFSYDIDNMYSINLNESDVDQIKKILSTRKGICENYAAVFTDVCLKAGIPSFVIDGYTKQNGIIDNVPHAWCASYIDSNWYMFDPTWASGYVANGIFVKKLNNTFYKIKPEVMLQSHMPFDYLWQLINYPITTAEFLTDKKAGKAAKPYFNFDDSLRVYQQQTDLEKMQSAARRIETNGVTNAMIFTYLRDVQISVETKKQNVNANLYNSATANYNVAITGFNYFIDYHNRQFIPEKPDAEVQSILDGVKTNLDSATEKLTLVQNTQAEITELSVQLNKAITDLQVRLTEQQTWLTSYFSKNKQKRKMMFFQKKISWFGIPLQK